MSCIAESGPTDRSDDDHVSSGATIATQRDRFVSCSGKVDRALERIGQTASTLNAFVEVDVAGAKRAARGHDRKKALASSSAGDCTVVAVKDNFAVAGTVMRAGSRVYSAVSARDASAVRRLRRGGAIIVGRTRLTEIAFGATGINRSDGGAQNPLDARVVPGGSSSGSAVAVAAQLCDAALGSDTGGSCRIPAALCGTFGFKPTYDLVSRAGLLPLSKTLDHVGWLGQSVDQIRRLLQMLVDRDRLDVSARGIYRIGILREQTEELDEAVASGLEWFIHQAESSGLKVAEVSISPTDHIVDVTTTIMFYEAFKAHETALLSASHKFDPAIRERLGQGAAIPRAAYLGALRERSRLAHSADQVFEGVDVIASPTVPISAPTREEAETPIGSPRVRRLLPRNARLHNLIAVPTLAMPLPHRVPAVSIQIAGPRASDAWLLRVGDHFNHQLLHTEDGRDDAARVSANGVGTEGVPTHYYQPMARAGAQLDGLCHVSA